MDNSNELSDVYHWIIYIYLIISLIPTLFFPEEITFPNPVNQPYRHMEITVWWAFASASFIILKKFSDPHDSLIYFSLIYSFTQIIALFSIRLWIYASWWTIMFLVLILKSTKYISWIPWIKSAFGFSSHSSRYETFLRIFSFMLAVGMLVGPIPRKWDEAPAAGLKFFRWYTYNNDHEVIWRANFTVFAFGNLLVAVNPVKNLSIILYFGCHGIMHSLTMLVDNRADVNGNGNWEHLVEIFVFLIWGIISLIHVKRMIQMQEDDKVVNSIPYR